MDKSGSAVGGGRGVTLLILALAVVGGFTALGHQMLWTRRMIDILGGTAESSSRVLGCFFLGLALGAAAAAWLAPKVKRPWRFLALWEGLILTSVIPFLFIPEVMESVWRALGSDAALGFPGAFVKTTASIAGVFPPAFLMGWFLPLAAKALFPVPDAFQRKVLWLYGVNTLGGVAGLGFLSLWGLSMMGVGGSFITLCVLHLLALAGFLLLDRWRAVVPALFAGRPSGDVAKPDGGTARVERVPAPEPDAAATVLPSEKVLLGLSFFSGFAILSFEVLSLEIMMLVAPLSFHAPAVILIGVILLLGVSALAAIPLRRNPGWLPYFFLLAAVATVLSSPLFLYLSRAMGGLPPAESFGVFWWKMLFLSLLSFGPALFFAGFVFPFLSVAWGRHEAKVGRSFQGHRWGWLLAANGVGGFLGAEIGYRVIMPVAGLHGGIGWIAGAYGLTGALMLISGAWSTRRTPVFALGGTVAVLVLWAGMTLLPQLPTMNPFLGLRVLWERSGPDGTVAVVANERIGRGILVSNQYFLGTISARSEQERQGHLPLLLHPSPRKVGFLGVATGMTPAAATRQTAPEEIVAFEISQSVLEASRNFFSEENGALHRNPRVSLLGEDARLGIVASEDRFDIVIGDLFLPWGPGEARLYSREHFRAVRRSLRSGGVFAQWLPLFQLREEHLASIVGTFREVFPETRFFIGGWQTSHPMLAVVGWKDGELSWDAVEARIREERENLKDPVLRHLSGVRLLHLGKNLSYSEAPRNTLNNLYLEMKASRERVVDTLESPYLSGSELLRWLDRQAGIEPSFENVRDLVQWEYENPGTFPGGESGKGRIPPEILEDDEGDWKPRLFHDP